MARFSSLLQYSNRYGALLLIAYIFINNSINATSDIMEANRAGSLPFQLWEPFVWEYSSAISTLLLVPAVLLLLAKYPFNWQAISRFVGVYWVASLVFSVLHVGLMIGLRKLVYWTCGVNYDFGLLWYEFLYEYRKDLLGFIFLIVVIKSYQYFIAQLKGEARVFQRTEETQQPQYERLLVKKLGKEFIIKVNEVDWLESSGNYVNLHIGERIYPIRATLTNLSQQLQVKGFCRIHRSFTIRMDAIESIAHNSSGDSEVTLIGGKKLPLSRRYKEQLKELLSIE